MASNKKENKNIEKKQNKILKEENKEEHLVEIDTKESVELKDDELISRINRLYGISSDPIKETKQYDPKELKEVQKKLVLLLTGIVIVGVIVLVIIINPFKYFNIKSKSTVKEEEKTEVVKDESIPLGEIELSNKIVYELNNRVRFDANDFYSIDLFPLYVNDVTEISSVSDDIKLYLFKKSTIFNDIFRDIDIESFLQTCNPEGLKLPKEKFDEVFANFYGPNINYIPQNINYLYLSDKIEAKKITLSYENETFVIRCNEYNNNNATITKYIQQDLTKAVKTKNSIELYQNIVFIKETGVYKDPNFNQLITNDPLTKQEDYISKGSLYKYTFIEDNDNYYLSKIEKIN